MITKIDKKNDKADKPQIYHNQPCSVKIKCQQIKRVGCKGVNPYSNMRDGCIKKK